MIASCGLCATVVAAALRPEPRQLPPHRLLHPVQHRGPRLAALVAVAVGQHRPLRRHLDRAGEIGYAHQPLVHQHRGHAFGDGHQALHRPAVLEMGRGSPQALMPAGICELAGLDRVVRAEHARERAEAGRAAADQPRLVELAATLARLEPCATMIGLGLGNRARGQPRAARTP